MGQRNVDSVDALRPPSLHEGRPFHISSASRLVLVEGRLKWGRVCSVPQDPTRRPSSKEEGSPPPASVPGRRAGPRTVGAPPPVSGGTPGTGDEGPRLTDPGDNDRRTGRHDVLGPEGVRRLRRDEQRSRVVSESGLIHKSFKHDFPPRTQRVFGEGLIIMIS